MLSGSTAVVVAALGLLGLVLSAVSVSALLLALRRLLDARTARPQLPAEDRPPAGLGRLVPVGAQVDEEARRGFVALENWLLQRRSGP